MNKYVVIGTFPNGNKKAFVVVADNNNKAIKMLLAEVNDNFNNIEVIDTYDNLAEIGMGSLPTVGDNFYRNASETLMLIERIMAEEKIEEAIDENGEATDEFHERFDKFYDFLTADGKDALLCMAGTAKRLVKIIELAGHDCL